MTDLQQQEALAILREIYGRRKWGRNFWLYRGDSVVDLDVEIVMRIELLLKAQSIVEGSASSAAAQTTEHGRNI